MRTIPEPPEPPSAFAPCRPPPPPDPDDASALLKVGDAPCPAPTYGPPGSNADPFHEPPLPPTGAGAPPPPPPAK